MHLIQEIQEKRETKRLEKQYSRIKRAMSARYGPLWLDVVNLNVRLNAQGKREIQFTIS